MKKNRLVGLLLTVALLIVAMVCQVVSALSEETMIVPGATATFNLTDYYVSTYGGQEYVFEVKDNGCIDVISKDGSVDYTISKEYDKKGRVVKVVTLDKNSNIKDQYSFDYHNDGSYVINQTKFNQVMDLCTYDPEIRGFYQMGWTYEFDQYGRKTKMSRTDTSDGTYVYTFSYETDPASGKVIKKYYTVYENGTKTDSGSVDITYTSDGSIHVEQIFTGEKQRTITNTFDNFNRLIKTVDYASYSTLVDDVVEESFKEVVCTYTYDEHHNLTSERRTISQTGCRPITFSYDLTYVYMPRNQYVPAIPVYDDSYYESFSSPYGPQSSRNDGDNIFIAMTNPDPSIIKTTDVQTFEDGHEYFINVVTEPLDASEDQVFAMNITGSDVNNIDKDDPAPAHSFAIYNSNVFSEDNLVATIENGKMTNATSNPIGENTAEPANAGGSGMLLMAAPVRAKADDTTGYNVSVMVPAGTLDPGKTYFFVIGRDMVTNDDEEKSTNTDIVFKFSTAKPHVHIEKTIPGKEPTCTEPGLKEGKECEECGEILLTQEEIPALGHDFIDGVCTRCGADDPDYKPEVPDEPNNDLDPSVNGIVQCPDGRWAMYKNGKVDTTCTTIAQNKYGWWRVENGYVNFEAQGIYQNKNGWWKTTNGKVTFLEFGLFENENGTWRVENSKVNFKANSIYKGKDGWYKTTNGKVTFDETGVFQNQFGWWYVKNSKVDFDYTGIASNNYGKWYINKGRVDFTKVGFVKVDGKTYTVMFGKVIFG